MLLLVGTAPLTFVAVCDGCNAREDPFEGTREAALKHYATRAWRFDERFTKGAMCPKCAGPPSVFSSAHVSAAPKRCTACNADVDACSACAVELHEGETISCRRAHGHAHVRCATQKIRRFTPPS